VKLAVGVGVMDRVILGVEVQTGVRVRVTVREKVGVMVGGVPVMVGVGVLVGWTAPSKSRRRAAALWLASPQ
jgi:hypothetical protein